MGMIIRQSPIFRPTYSASGGGAGISDGQSVTITGSGFGTNPTTQDYLGGPGNAIEVASNGTAWLTLAYPGWSNSDNSAAVTTTRALTRTKSIFVTYPTWNAMGLVRDFQSVGGYKARYCRGYYYLDSGAQTVGQVKWWRDVGVLASTIPVGGDGSTNANGVVNTNSVHSDGRLPNTLGHDYWTAGPKAYITAQSTGHPGDEDDLAPSGGLMLNQWVMLEGMFIPDDPRGAGNASYQTRSTNPLTGTVNGSSTISGVTFWNGSDSSFFWFVLQMYIGNEMQQTGVSIYVDPDHYLAVNAASSTIKYVLLGNASTYAACDKHLMSLCPYTSWADGSITFTAVKGLLPNLTSVWGYAMNGINSAINSSGIVPA